jgi:hypothetical protein
MSNASRIADLKVEIRKLQIELSELENADREERSPFKIGETIWYGRSPRRMRIQKIIAGVGSESLDYIGVRVRNDGSDGAQVRAYSWDNPRLTP